MEGWSRAFPHTAPGLVLARDQLPAPVTEGRPRAPEETAPTSEKGWSPEDPVLESASQSSDLDGACRCGGARLRGSERIRSVGPILYREIWPQILGRPPRFPPTPSSTAEGFPKEVPPPARPELAAHAAGKFPAGPDSRLWTAPTQCFGARCLRRGRGRHILRIAVTSNRHRLIWAMLVVSASASGASAHMSHTGAPPFEHVLCDECRHTGSIQSPRFCSSACLVRRCKRKRRSPIAVPDHWSQSPKRRI